jgi:hypothetical protein
MRYHSTWAHPGAQRLESVQPTLRTVGGVAFLALWLVGVGALVVELLRWYAELVLLSWSRVPAPWWETLR